MIQTGLGNYVNEIVKKKIIKTIFLKVNLFNTIKFIFN